MIGLQESIKKREIKITHLAKEMGLNNASCFWKWFRGVESIPTKHLEFLSKKLNIDKDYLIKQVNDINTYKPRGIKNEYVVIDENKTVMIVENKKYGRIEVEIDTEEVGLIKDFSWYARLDRGRYYITTTLHVCDIKDRKYKAMSLALARMITQTYDDNTRVDHKDGNSLKNYKDNLRCTNNSLNLKNRQKGKNINNKSGFRNVFWSTGDNRWLVMLQIEGKQTCFGRYKFEDLEKAGVRAEEMRQKYYGKFAGKN